MSQADQNDLTALTVQLLSAYVSKNDVASTDLADLIHTTRAALAGTPVVEESTEQVFTPAVSVRKSLASRDHILSLIDGKPYKTLKRHLASHGLSPKEYLERYKLPKDYPFVAPAYSDIRRETAAKIGLGRKARPVAAPSAPASVSISKAAEVPASTSPKIKTKKSPALKTVSVKTQPAESPIVAPKKVAFARKPRATKSAVETPAAPKKEAKSNVVEAPAVAKRKVGRPPKSKEAAPSAE